MTFKSALTDLSAGLVVYLVSLPLSLGIALSSDAPLISGIISGIIAGLFVSWLSGSSLSVSGPAAGLVTIVSVGISATGSFSVFLSSVFVCGLLQLMGGILRLSTLAHYIPNSVIKGVLTSIGIIIIFKQIPHSLGLDQDFVSDLNFDGIRTGNFSALGMNNGFADIHIGAILMTITCFFFLWLAKTQRFTSLKISIILPGPLLAALAGIGINYIFINYFPTLALTTKNGHLVKIPEFANWREITSQMHIMQFSKLLNHNVLQLGLTLAIVASLETLLSIEATDKLDPLRRTSSVNRELVAQGCGNIMASLLGGLPMTSVIVTSSANIYAGGKSRLSCFTHGILLLLSILVLPSFLNQIPLAALAAILINVGYHLASIKIFKKIYSLGWDQFTPFIATVAGIAAMDILSGTILGWIVGIFILAWKASKDNFTLVKTGNNYYLQFHSDAYFLSKANLKEALRQIPKNSSITIDTTQSKEISLDIIEVINDFNIEASYRNIHVDLSKFINKQLT